MMDANGMHGWIATKDEFPRDGQEVTIFMRLGQVKQVVRDEKFCGGWKQANCAGWESVAWDVGSVTHWRPEIFVRPNVTGPSDAPWMV